METQETAAPKKPMTKTEIVTSLSEATDRTKQQVSGLFNELAKLIEKSLNEDGPGEFAIPHLEQAISILLPHSLQNLAPSRFSN